MAIASCEISTLADVVFVIEGTAINGAYLNDIKGNYIVPTLEYFNQGNLEEREYICESTNALYGIVVYHAADRLPSPSTDIYGPYSNPHKVLQLLEKLELIGGRGESQANIAEGLASALICLEDLSVRREAGMLPQKHCVLICNSPPYLMPVMENQSYVGNTVEQLASIFSEKSVHLSVLSPRRIPAMFKLFEKAGGDLLASQSKNYAKDPRHLVLLKGFSLKERPVSPTGGGHIAVSSLSSPLQSHGSPMASVPQTTQPNAPPPQNLLQTTAGQSVVGTNAAVTAGRGFPPAYGVRSASLPRWPLLPPQGPRYSTPGSALIEQLTRPPNAIPPQFNNSSNMNQTGLNTQQAPSQTVQQQQTQQLRLMGQNVMGQSQIGQQQQPILPQNAQNMIAQQTNVNVVHPMPPQGSMLPNQQINQTNAMQQQTPVSQMNQNTAQQQLQPQGSREKHVIWQGIIEWMDKKLPNEKRQVTCSVSAAIKDGKPDLKADTWPQKLLMQLMPKTLIGNIGGQYLKNSKSVVFHPQPCEALDSLTKIMTSGYTGCVHFSHTPACDVKVLILVYTPDKRCYLGFIPNDQLAFVDRLRKVIHHQKTASKQAQPVSGQANTMGQQPTAAIQPATGSGLNQTQGLAQPAGLPQQTPNPQTSMAGMLQPPSQPICAQVQPGTQMMTTIPNEQNQQTGQGPFNTHLVEARQENLVKIQRLRQTLEAAQQQELQYKNQLEIMNQMKLQVPMQDTINMHPGQTQDQFKAQLEQEQQKQLRAQLQQIQQQQQQLRGMAPQQGAGQQRMMRPAMSNNPGLRHLLQQPQYRINLQQQLPRPGMPNQPNQQTQSQTFEEVSSYDFLN